MGVPSQVMVSALDGLSRAEARLEKSAERLARLPEAAASPEDQVSLTDEVINLLQARNTYEANLKSLETANEIEKHVIDLLA